ncbi:MAG TPA: hypothetical protein VIH76_07350 [Candidatus Acidoferrales bacterium]
MNTAANYVRVSTADQHAGSQLYVLRELAAAKLRSGEGRDEETTGHVFREILHVHRDHLKKAFAPALLSGNF